MEPSHSKPKSLHIFCAIWRETITGRSCGCKNSPRRMEMWSLRRLRVTRCLQRLHVRGNDVWRWWSQRRPPPFVVGGSFCVKREELRSRCLLGGEEMQINLFTSQPFECDAPFRERLGRPSLARLGGHFHQDRTVKILELLRLSHIVSKNKECWRGLSWRICSQPQTLVLARMTVPQTSAHAITTGPRTSTD